MLGIKEQTAVIFKPEKLSLDYAFGLPEFTTEVFVPVENDVELNGFLYQKPGNTFLMVYFQGNAKNLQNFLDCHRMVFGWGYDILVTDYRGFGKSGGEITSEAQLYGDAEKVYQYAMALGYRPDQVILYGYSMGVSMACHLAGSVSARAVIMESGYSSVDEMPFAHGLCPAYCLNNGLKAKSVSMPALVLHGELDEIITPDHADRILGGLGSAIKKKVVLAGGGHGDLRDRPGYQQLVNGFIEGL